MNIISYITNRTTHREGDIVVATEDMKSAHPKMFDDEYEIFEVKSNSLKYTGYQFIKITPDPMPGDGYYGSAFKKKL